MKNEEISEAIRIISLQQNNIVSILRIIYKQLYKQDSEILDLLKGYDKNDTLLSKMINK